MSKEYRAEKVSTLDGYFLVAVMDVIDEATGEVVVEQGEYFTQQHLAEATSRMIEVASALVKVSARLQEEVS